MKRELAALGCPPFEPTDEQRRMVRIFAFNGLDHERIASILEIRPIELVYHFRRELDLSEDVILGQAAATVIELSQQRSDLGVALRASDSMLRARLPRWRIPTDDSQGGKPVESMNLVEVDQAIAELERRRRLAAEAPDQEAAAPGEPGQPD